MGVGKKRGGLKRGVKRMKKGGLKKRGKKNEKSDFGLSFLRIRAGKDWYDLDDKISQTKSRECSLHQLLGDCKLVQC